MKIQILESSSKIVMLNIEGFKKLLQAVPKKLLISEFAKVYSQQKGWKKLKKDEIIDDILNWAYYQIGI